MEKIYQLRNILEKAFKTEGQERFDNINFFLKEVWEDEAITDEKINDLLTDIAYDLEFYEPSNGNWSIDTSIYYDGEKMDRMLDEAIKNIDTLLVNLGYNDNFKHKIVEECRLINLLKKALITEE